MVEATFKTVQPRNLTMMHLAGLISLFHVPRRINAIFLQQHTLPYFSQLVTRRWLMAYSTNASAEHLKT